MLRHDFAGIVSEDLCSKVGCHNEYGISKVDFDALGVREESFIKDL